MCSEAPSNRMVAKEASGSARPEGSHERGDMQLDATGKNQHDRHAFADLQRMRQSMQHDVLAFRRERSARPGSERYGIEGTHLRLTARLQRLVHHRHAREWTLDTDQLHGPRTYILQRQVDRRDIGPGWRLAYPGAGDDQVAVESQADAGRQHGKQQ